MLYRTQSAVLGGIDDGVAMPFQISDHHLAVQDVHLAANGLDVDTFIHQLSWFISCVCSSVVLVRQLIFESIVLIRAVFSGTGQ